MKILITGSSGFLGSHLGEFLHSLGHEVVGGLRGGDRKPSASAQISQFYVVNLEGEMDEKAFDGTDLVVHCIHDPSVGALRKNIEGTKKIAEMARGRGVKKQLFVSSYSANPQAQSEYGKSKYQLEQYFLSQDHSLVRPGLILGKGGIFLRLFRMVQKYPLLPLVDGGKDKVPVIDIQTFQKSFTKVLEKIFSPEKRPMGEYNLFSKELVPLREIVFSIRKALNRRVLLVPLPSILLIPPLLLCQFLRIPLPINLENLRGLKINQRQIHQSNLFELLGWEPTSQEMMEKALEVVRSAP